MVIISGHCGQSLKIFFGSAWAKLLANKVISSDAFKRIRMDGSLP